MFKKILSGEQDLDIIAIVALVSFFVFFALIIWKTLSIKKSDISHAEQLPFEPDTNKKNNSKTF